MTRRGNAEAERVGQIFDDSLSVLKDSQVDRVSTIAKRTSTRRRRGRISVLKNHEVFNIPSFTGFDLLEVGTAPTGLYTAAIIVDFDRVLKVHNSDPNAVTDIVAADLARTIAVADQTRLNGFQRRYSAVYGDALDVQTEWLEQTNAPQVLFDPRTSDRDKLLTKLVREDRYYLDVGFEDWQAAVDRYRQTTEDRSVIATLGQIKHDEEHFIAMRHSSVPTYYRNLIINGTKQRHANDPEKRAEIVADALVSATISAR